LTGQLVKHLTSTSAVEREIAILAYRDAVPEEIFNELIKILAVSDETSDVRETAIEEVRRSGLPGGLPVLKRIVDDPSKTKRERELAFQSATDISVAPDADQAQVVLASGSGIAPHSRERGSVFATAVLKGIKGAAADADGNVSIRDLYAFVEDESLLYGIRPSFFGKNLEPEPLPLVSRKSFYDSILGVVVAVSDYPTLENLPGAASDAASFHDVITSSWKRTTPDVDVRLLTNGEATRGQVLEALRDVGESSQPGSLFIFYFSGHAQLDPFGDLILVTHDFDKTPHFGLRWSDINEVGTRARLRVVFLDAEHSTMAGLK